MTHLPLSGLRVLLIDNDSDTLRQLVDTCERNGCEVQVVRAAEAPVRPDAERVDCVILSGGIWHDDEAKQRSAYANEVELIRACTLPLMGICLGMQLMQVASDGEVPRLAEPQSGLAPITVLPAGQERLGLPAELMVYKNHTRGIITPPAFFDVLAVTDDRTEIIRHRERPMIGVQFHPELGDEPGRSDVFLRCLNDVLKPAVR